MEIKTFVVKRGTDFFLFDVNEIAAFHCNNRVTFAYNGCGEKFIVNHALIELEHKLDGSLFFRANRQFLVNRKFIERFSLTKDNDYLLLLRIKKCPKIIMVAEKFSKFNTWATEGKKEISQ